MHILEATGWRRLITALAIALSAAALVACGEDSDADDSASSSAGGGGSATSSNERDEARVRLRECLREQGLDIPDDAGQGGSAFRDLDNDKLEEALEGPCAKYRGQAFGDVEDSALAEAQEKMDKYAQCMRDAGFDFPDVELGKGPPTELHEIDQTDPDFQAAAEQCADKRPGMSDIMPGGG